MFAQAYRVRGWSVFPIPGGTKKPNRPWKLWQQQRPRLDGFREWARLYPEANWAIVTAGISGLVVVDIDSGKYPRAAQAFAERCGGELPAAPLVKTGSGGIHLYFDHPGGLVRNRAGILPGVDLRGDGGFVVAPPSVNGSGGRYEWVSDMATLPPVPAWLLASEAGALPVFDQGTEELPSPLLVKSQGIQPRTFRPIPKGQRNDTLFRRACGMRAGGWDGAFIRSELHAMNRVCCVPPLESEEIDRIAASVAQYPPG